MALQPGTLNVEPYNLGCNYFHSIHYHKTLLREREKKEGNQMRYRPFHIF